QFLRLMYRDRGPYCVSQARAELQQKIRLITEDSRTFCPEHAGLAGSQDLVLVDGGHDFDTQMNDSLKAFQLGKPDSVIIWHDYGSAIHTDVALLSLFLLTGAWQLVLLISLASFIGNGPSILLA
ncbi:MAG: class I SAM-dependent methyltransferase, partial [Planctomyces sp.]